MSKIDHKVEVFELSHIDEHPKADRLFRSTALGYPIIFGKDNGYQVGDLLAFVPPDSIVPTDREEFAWLKREGRDKHRVTACKLRGLPSYGIVLKAPPGSKVGDDVSEYFGVSHWNPPEKVTLHDDNVKPPRIRIREELAGELFMPHYDLTNIRKYRHLFKDGEAVWVTEKLHGANGRFVYSSAENQFFCGSRNHFKKETENNLWWKALRSSPELQDFLKSNPDVAVYGEVVGNVRGFNYGCKPGEVKFYAFDVLKNGVWLDPEEASDFAAGINWVPVLRVNWSFNFDELLKLAEGQTTVKNAQHVREGIVVVPSKERTDEEIGRVKLKLVGLGYLMKDQEIGDEVNEASEF